MIVLIAQSSIATLDKLSQLAYCELNYYEDAIRAATSIISLKALLLDDINVEDDQSFNIAIKSNETHVVANINGLINEQREITLHIQCYD